MNYLIAVLSDRIQAENAYSLLEREGFPLQQATLLGKGYKSADEFGLVDPNEQAHKQARWMAYWLVPFGFAAGLTFSLITGLHTFSWAGEVGNHLVGGLLGAASGALGSLFVGGGVGMVMGRGDALPYRDRLNQGKYLLVIQGSQILTDRATRILKQANLESLQDYTTP